MKAWGFNAFGAGGDRSLCRRGLAHCGFISIGERSADFGSDYEIIDPAAGLELDPNMEQTSGNWKLIVKAQSVSVAYSEPGTFLMAR